MTNEALNNLTPTLLTPIVFSSRPSSCSSENKRSHCVLSRVPDILDIDGLEDKKGAAGGLSNFDKSLIFKTAVKL